MDPQALEPRSLPMSWPPSAILSAIVSPPPAKASEVQFLSCCQCMRTERVVALFMHIGANALSKQVGK
jgi:hypothetical protein